ncbi:hypothetical protein BRAS3843_990016 [Bradyrhizobium sp. STM 3843]|nr:hypothetical protein BRAS3843_990016 [Bradyrhizobium sp. STM 3843]
MPPGLPAQFPPPSPMQWPVSCASPPKLPTRQVAAAAECSGAFSEIAENDFVRAIRIRLTSGRTPIRQDFKVSNCRASGCARQT